MFLCVKIFFQPDFPFLISIERIKIRCYKMNRSYGTFLICGYFLIFNSQFLIQNLMFVKFQIN